MLTAMDDRPFVTMGSSYREIDYERVWSNHISKLAKKKRSSAVDACSSNGRVYTDVLCRER
jgi:spore maturation protein CgeB